MENTSLIVSDATQTLTSAPAEITAAPAGVEYAAGPVKRGKIKPARKPAAFGLIYHARKSGSVITADADIIGSSGSVIYTTGEPIRFQLIELNGKTATIRRHKREFNAAGVELPRDPFNVKTSDLTATR